jgi:hypothetical protein
MKTLKQFKEEYKIDERYDKDLDADGNGKLTKKDFELLRSKKKKSDCCEESEIEEDCGAYETWDPKHPNFVKNYKKYQKDNSGQGSMKDFIDKEKARPTRLPK